ncbi:hypothetical protein DVR12_21590 [Chitinophaga silvatica]|uniref:Uncharacterized protein n=1 Tax=Chitinophaga silvatica TaxID=2282649 RepID=A0A3E1Y4R1_9BACT|nr:hypothetical protein [Chitinophaga silvatica]RFS19700.1 hypothetical protein DVR12_21590 [Chitinophaga silvatica]
MKTWLYLPLLLLVGFITPSCKKTYNEVVIPNQTILVDAKTSDWVYSSIDQTYNFAVSVPELNNVNQLDGVIVSMARFQANSNATPQEFEMLPQVFANQSYNVLHDNANVFVQIKGINGVASAPPPTTVRIKIVLIPSAQ